MGRGRVPGQDPPPPHQRRFGGPSEDQSWQAPPAAPPDTGPPTSGLSPWAPTHDQQPGYPQPGYNQPPDYDHDPGYGQEPGYRQPPGSGMVPPQPDTGLLPDVPDERPPDNSWLNQLGPRELGQRHPDTGEVPLYNAQLGGAPPTSYERDLVLPQSPFADDLNPDNRWGGPDSHWGAADGGTVGLATAPAPAIGDDDFDEDEDGNIRPPESIPELPYLKGLDGLRAIALIAILGFAGGMSQVAGGFLGISTALTLSGFLLGSAVLGEWGERSKLAVLGLWERRARRIVPATYAVVALVVILQIVLRVGSVPSFRTDVVAAVTFLTNWQLTMPTDGFVQSFQGMSALRHLWPVAIVVQLTLLLSLLLSGLLAVADRKWRVSAALLALLAGASFATAWVMSSNPEAADVVYYGTHTRAGEVLAGVVLAFLVLTPGFRSIISRPLVMTVIRLGAPVGAVGLALLWISVARDNSSLFQGVTLLNAVLTCWVVLALTMSGPVNTVLSSWPLRKLGEISFAAYLLHWPLFLLLDEDLTSLDGPVLLVVRVAATLAAAAALAWLVEATFRWKLQLPRMQLAAGVGLVAAVLVALTMVLPVNPPANISLTIDGESDPGRLDAVTPAGEEAARVLLVGDQTAAGMLPGFEAWNEANPDAGLRVDTHVAADCPIGGPWDVRRFGSTLEPSDECVAWRYRLPRMVDAADYDVVLVAMGTADLGEREIRRTWHHLGEAAFDQWLVDQVESLVTHLGETGAPVLWATSPHVRVVPSEDEVGEVDRVDGPIEWSDFDDNDPQRVDRLNMLLNAVARADDDVTLVDLDAWFQNQPRGEFNPAVREGADLTEEGAQIAVAWLAPQILEAVGAEPPEGDVGERPDPDSGDADGDADAGADEGPGEAPDGDVPDEDADGEGDAPDGGELEELPGAGPGE